MKKTFVVFFALTLMWPFSGGFAMEAADARQPYAETLLAVPAEFELFVAMDVGPDGAVAAVARAVNGSYSLVRWRDLADEPETAPLALSDGEIDAVSIAPDGGVLVTLSAGLSAMRMESGGGRTSAQNQRGGQGPQTARSGFSMATVFCWFDAAGMETARFEVQDMVQRFAALPGYEAAVLSLQGGVQVVDRSGAVVSRIGESEPVYNMAVSADSLYTFGPESIIEWSLVTGDKIRAVSAQTGFSARAAVGPDGALYFAETQGVYRLGRDEAQVSYIVSAIGTLIGDPGNALQAMAVRPDGSIAVLLSEGMGMVGGGMAAYQIGGPQRETQLALYTRLDIAQSDRQPFVITALSDSVRLRKAATDFQRAHPELAVDLRIQAPSGSFFQETPDDDYIRGLNADLLAGGGGDVIILDRLPIHRYIGRGILADISHLVPELGILSGIAEGSVSADGCVYALPAQFSFQMLWGHREALEGVRSLGDIPYAVLTGEQRPMFGRSPEEWIRLTFPASEAAFRNENGLVRFDAPMFETYLETLYQLYTEQDDMPPDAMFAGMRRAGVSPDEMQAMLGGAVAMYPAEVRSLMQLSLAYSISGAEESDGIVFPSISGDGYAYTPQLLVGVNARSARRDMADEFIRMLFSDSIQASDQMSGLPTTVSALDALFAEALERSDREGNVIAMMSISGGGTSLTMAEPDRETLAALRDICDTLTVPVFVDETLMAFVIEETSRFFDGVVSAADAARAIEQRAWYYQNE